MAISVDQNESAVGGKHSKETISLLPKLGASLGFWDAILTHRNCDLYLRYTTPRRWPRFFQYAIRGPDRIAPGSNSTHAHAKF